MQVTPFLTLEIPNSDGYPKLSNFMKHTDIMLKSSTVIDLLMEIMSEDISRQEISKIVSVLIETNEDISKKFVEILESRGIISESSELVDQLDLMQKEWSDLGWEAAFYFHLFTRDYPFLDYSVDGTSLDMQLMKDYQSITERVSNIKNYDGYGFISLEKPTEQSLMNKDDWSSFFSLKASRKSKQSTSISDLSDILYYVAGKSGEKNWSGQGKFLFKHIPSGGARHPTEVYVANLRSNDFPIGIYHYNVEQHGLDIIAKLDLDQLLELVNLSVPDLKRRGPDTPNFVFFFTSYVERSMWRYRDARSFRVILIDLGHVLNAFRMISIGAGLIPWVGQGINPIHAANLLSIDITNEPVFFSGAL